MEKKTLGAFLAALRRASGMTQRELAERLNVSDKAVSRWERDESAPDLTLIPVIAEIFGITSDELLRGERSTGIINAERAAAKTEMQLSHLVKDTQTRFHIRSAISVAIALVGLIAAIIGNSGFLRAYIGFMVGCIFFVAATVCEVIFLIHGLSALDSDEFDTALTTSGKRQIIKGAEWIFGIIFVSFALCLPLVVLVSDTYMGLQTASWIGSGLIFAAIAAVLALVIIYLVNVKLGIQPRPELRSPLGKLRIRCIKLALFLVLCLGLGHIFLATFLASNLYLVADHHKFDTLEDFKTFMETPTAYEDGSPTAQLPIADSNVDKIYELPHDAHVEEIYAHIDDTEPLLTFRWLNNAVTYINYGDASNDLLPIYAMSSAQVRHANRACERICVGYCITYFVALGCVLYYYKKKRKAQ